MVGLGLVLQRCWVVVVSQLSPAASRGRPIIPPESHPIPNAGIAHRPPFAWRSHLGSGTACTATAQVAWGPPLFTCGDLLHIVDIARLNDALDPFR
eukprot:6037131-Pyramimonas_sp.AAC.1